MAYPWKLERGRHKNGLLKALSLLRSINWPIAIISILLSVALFLHVRGCFKELDNTNHSEVILKDEQER